MLKLKTVLLALVIAVPAAAATYDAVSDGCSCPCGDDCPCGALCDC